MGTRIGGTEPKKVACPACGKRIRKTRLLKHLDKKHPNK
jgi:hypothetical protein